MHSNTQHPTIYIISGPICTCSINKTLFQATDNYFPVSATLQMWIMLTPAVGCFCVSCSAETLDIWPDEHSSWTGEVFEAVVGLDALGARGVSTFSTLPVCGTETTAGGEAGRVVICLLVKTLGSPHWREVDTWGGFKGALFLDWNWGSLQIPWGKEKT